ncbi:class D beta-lactamase [Algoriphagus sediminis]|uniref:Beta-lactamase n=1 Tax=Algoriphagus sediminis TaxID=3057113 RepID=A0ABT7Y9S1_9BACT|nr:class D beta-lactamase [Algoriphagus sediminis]MDN3203268.1 class D beta-lactamase [Algoriphagus sediminis]
MKKFFLIVIIITACNQQKPVAPAIMLDSPQEFIQEEFQAILDSAKVRGTILILDEVENKFYSNDFDWARAGQLPASTFKIPNSIIALESGVVENDSTILVWDGEPRRMSSWEEDMTLKQAFLRSCLPCYRKIAREVGLERMKALANKLDYGNLKFDSTNLDLFWVEGESRITPFEQIDFLIRLANSELPISERTEELVKKIMILEEGENYTLRAKTGWSIVNNQNNGWFVGYLTYEDRKYFFATNVEPGKDFHMDDFARIRGKVTMKALKVLGVKTSS